MRISPSIVLLRTQSDERLVALAAEGSEPAFTALVERYRRTVLRACMRVLPEARAEDATQQVFVSAWKALTRGDDVQNVRAWLQRIARNTALNGLRTPGYEYDELAESLQGGSAPPAELERREVMRQTLTGLAALPDNQREALLRSAVQGASHADIARDLGLSEGATRQLVLRARATLRSAASALTPLPLINWAASGSGAPMAEAAAGGSAAGASLLLAKVGTVAVLAGGAVATPVIVHHVRKVKPEAARAAERAPKPARRTPATPGAEAAVAVTAAPHVRTTASRKRSSGEGEHAPSRGSGPSHSGSGAKGSDDSSGSNSGSGSGSSGSSGSGSSGSSDSGGSGSSGSDSSGSSGSGHSGSGHGGGDDNSSSGHGNSGNSGSGGGDDNEDEAAVVEATPTVAATTVATPEAEDHSGHGGGGGDHSGHGGGDDGNDDD